MFETVNGARLFYERYGSDQPGRLPLVLIHGAGGGILWGYANLAAATLCGYDPMLSPGKLREISHPDWLCDSHDFASAMGWQAAVRLEEGLARGYGSRHPRTP